MKTLPKNEKIKPLIVNQEDIDKAIEALYKITGDLTENIEYNDWYYSLVPSTKGLIIETYAEADAHLDEPNHQLKTFDWDWVFSDMFTTAEGKVNRPMIAAFTKGLNELIAELNKNGEVCISRHLKQATDLIEG